MKLILAIMTAFCMIFAGGCSDGMMGSDSLLRPPRATGDKAEIQDIISQEAGGSYTLKYPQTGDNRSAITMRNEDTDSEYAVALYSTESDSRLNVSIITYTDEKWSCIGTFSNNWSGVDRVIFEDISGDKTDEIIIGWTNYNSSQKSLTVYSMTTEGAYEMAVQETYDEIVVGDILGDQTNDIVLLSLSTQEEPSNALLLQYSEQDKNPIGRYSMEIDSNIVSFENISLGDVAVNTEPAAGDVKITSTGPTTETADSSADTEESSKKNESGTDESSKKKKTEKSTSRDDASDDGSTESGKPVTVTEKSAADDDENSEAASADDEDVSSDAADASTDNEDESSGDEDNEETSVGDEVIVHKDRSDTENEADENSEGIEENSVVVLPDDGSKITTAVKTGIVLDCKRSDKTYCTHMIYYDRAHDELVNPVMEEVADGNYGKNPTIRADNIISRDINGDSIIDIPVVSGMMASSDEKGSNVCNITLWKNYDAKNGILTTVFNTIINKNDGYFFIMPERWDGNVTARTDVDKRELTFYIWNSKTNSEGDKLLTLYRFTPQQWAAEEGDDIFMLDITDVESNTIFAARIFITNANDELNIKQEEVQSSVVLL